MPISDATQKNGPKKNSKEHVYLSDWMRLVVVGESRCYYNSIDHYSFNNRHGLSLARKTAFLPFADLAVVPFRVAMVVALTRGNLLKNIVIGLVITASLLWCGSATSPMLTAIAKSVGIDLGTSSMLISSFAATSMIQSYLVFIAFAYKTNHRDSGLIVGIGRCMVLL